MTTLSYDNTTGKLSPESHLMDYNWGEARQYKNLFQKRVLVGDNGFFLSDGVPAAHRFCKPGSGYSWRPGD